MTIYIVTSGEYSDYKIRAVFTDKKMAYDCAKLFEKADWRVEEHEDTQVIPLCYRWHATLDVDGRMTTGEFDQPVTEQSNTMRMRADSQGTLSLHTFGTWGYVDKDGNHIGASRKGCGDRYTLLDTREGLCAYGETEEHAKKNVTDAMAKAKAILAGVT